MFGNYATGGAINFRLWRGDQINGARYGVEGGSFGYLNNYAIIGGRNEGAEGTAFMSDVRGDGYISHSAFNTQTFNALGTYSVTPDDRVTFKAIENKLTTDLSVRLSLNQFMNNPFQRGCINAVSAAPGCATINLLANGFAGATISQTAEEAALGRHDWRFRPTNHLANASRVRRQEHQPTDRNDQRNRRQPVVQLADQCDPTRQLLRFRRGPFCGAVLRAPTPDQLHLERHPRRWPRVIVVVL